MKISNEAGLNQEYIDRFLDIEGLHPLVAECDFTISEVRQKDIPEVDLNIYRSNRNRFKEIITAPLDPIEYILARKFDYYSSLGMLDSIPLDLLAHDNRSHTFIPVSHMYAFEISAHLANLQRSLGAIMFLTGSQGDNFGDPSFDPATHDLDIQFLISGDVTDIENKLIQYGNQYRMSSNRGGWDLTRSSNIPGHFYSVNVSPLSLKWLSTNFKNYVEKNLSSSSVKILQKGWRTFKIRLNVNEKRASFTDYGRTMVEVGFPDIEGLPSVFYDFKKSKNLFRYSPDEPWYFMQLHSKPTYENIKTIHPLLAAIMSLRCVTKHKVGDDLAVINSISISHLNELREFISESKYHKTFVVPLLEYLADDDQDPLLFISAGFYNLMSKFFPRFTDHTFGCLIYYLKACKVGTEDIKKEYTYHLITQLWLNTKKETEEKKITKYTYYQQCLDLIKFKIAFNNPSMKESVLNNKLKLELENLFKILNA